MFRFVTFGFTDIVEFKQKYMDDASEEAVSSDQSFEKPNVDKLRGFKFEGIDEAEPD